MQIDTLAPTDVPTLAEEFSRLALRLEHVLHLDAMLDDGRVPENLKKVFSDDFDAICAALCHEFLQPQSLTPVNADHLGKMIEEYAYANHQPIGWMVKTCQRKFTVSENQEIHFAWAPVQTSWFYARSYEAAQEAALDWATAYSLEVWDDSLDRDKPE